MIFSSYPFILFFLPLVLLAVWALRRAGHEWVLLFLNAASLFFYAWWDWHFLWVILSSIVANYIFGFFLDGSRSNAQRFLLASGIAFNLIFLCWFKYTNFLIENSNILLGTHFNLLNVVLPLGVSFFTFTQIAYLVDVYKGEATEHDFRHYLLFVTFFPHLIAGPIVHHKQLMPQFVAGLTGRLRAESFATGLSIFVLGVAKKILIADPTGRYAAPVFDAASSGIPIPLLEAWGGVLAYTLQIYFDFSAYSDMAIGLGLMFGIAFPVNFFSPYKADNLIDFWKRWHITLSRFLRDYLYIPLGGNRAGRVRRYANLLIVMTLGGLWHGASWTFVIWGGLNGLGIVVNHLWRWMRGTNATSGRPDGILSRWSGRISTFLFVMLAWVFFRASDLPAALNILNGMAGINGIVLPRSYLDKLGPLAQVLLESGWRFESGYLFLGLQQVFWLAGLLVVVWFLPNSMEWSRYHAGSDSAPAGSAYPRWLMWEANTAWALTMSALAILSLYYMSRVGEFLYFQF